MAQWTDAAAVFSPCGCYRYALWRSWQGGEGELLVVGLNPSTADALSDDATLRRCIGFARNWGFAGLRLANLFAWRSRDPRLLQRVADPVGPENDRWLRRLAAGSAMRLVAWGARGQLGGRAERVLDLLPERHCLGFTRSGQPCHPLYLPATRRPRPWQL